MKGATWYPGSHLERIGDRQAQGRMGRNAHISNNAEVHSSRQQLGWSLSISTLPG